MIIGLGNHGAKYEGTRHNAGFEVLDKLCGKENFCGSPFAVNKRLYSEMSRANLFADDVWLAKPVTYMNDSGKAALAITKFYKIDLADLLIIHDDVSLPLGKIRIQKQGGAGGQHGVESIIEYLGGNKGFNRLKIGIGPDPGGDTRADYVLNKFSAKERKIVDAVVSEAAEACFSWLTLGVEQTMNVFNGLDLCE